jgi:hypothetical protein
MRVLVITAVWLLVVLALGIGAAMTVAELDPNGSIREHVRCIGESPSFAICP